MTPKTFDRVISLLASAEILVGETVEQVAADSSRTGADVTLGRKLSAVFDALSTLNRQVASLAVEFPADDPRRGLPTKPSG